MCFTWICVEFLHDIAPNINVLLVLKIVHNRQTSFPSYIMPNLYLIATTTVDTHRYLLHKKIMFPRLLSFLKNLSSTCCVQKKTQSYTWTLFVSFFMTMFWTNKANSPFGREQTFLVINIICPLCWVPTEYIEQTRWKWGCWALETNCYIFCLLKILTVWHSIRIIFLTGKPEVWKAWKCILLDMSGLFLTD